jgi:hypothetical protein
VLSGFGILPISCGDICIRSANSDVGDRSNDFLEDKWQRGVAALIRTMNEWRLAAGTTHVENGPSVTQWAAISNG